MAKPLTALVSRIRALALTPRIAPPDSELEFPKDNLSKAVNEETIEAMLENLRRLVAYEEQRLTSLTTRGSGLAGLSSVAAAVLSAAGSASGLPLASRILFVGAIAGLVFTVGGVVLGMVTTREATIQSTRQVALYRDPSIRHVSPARIKVQIIDVLIDRLEALRDQNLIRAAWLNRCALALAISVFLAGCAAVIKFFA